jgi:hypothetical protein
MLTCDAMQAFKIYLNISNIYQYNIFTWIFLQIKTKQLHILEQLDIERKTYIHITKGLDLP